MMLSCSRSYGAQDESMNFFFKYLAFFTLIGFSHLLIASDHGDGSIAENNPRADIVDFYAFRDLSDDQSLVLIMNVFPYVKSYNHFSEQVSYEFVLRSLQKETNGFVGSKDRKIRCLFSTKGNHSDHRMRCYLENRLMITTELNRYSRTNLVSLFAGHRADPFFLNFKWSFQIGTEGVIPPKAVTNTMYGKNILGIVLKFPIKLVFPNNSLKLIGIAAQTKDRYGKVKRIFDRSGRPEIVNISMYPANDNGINDKYNSQEAFPESLMFRELFSKRLSKNISFYDQIDGVVDWNKASLSKLVKLLLDDYLIIDFSKDKVCSGDNYFEVEKAFLEKEVSQTCGGRKPEDDIMDRMYSTYINGNRFLIEDGIDGPSKAISKTFPFLAAPY